jgi:hypothetical protein
MALAGNGSRAVWRARGRASPQVGINDVVQIQGRWLLEIAPHYYRARTLHGQAPGQGPNKRARL